MQNTNKILISGANGYIGQELIRLASENFSVVTMVREESRAPELPGLETRRVNLNNIVGGGCIYLLLGMSWGILYMYIVWADPASFAGIDPEGRTLYWDLNYFSFVTLTTLGYGDILPISPAARALAYIEAVVGQISEQDQGPVEQHEETRKQGRTVPP